jgi:hypothetical protein
LGPLQAHIEGFDLHARLAIATASSGAVDHKTPHDGKIPRYI